VYSFASQLASASEHLILYLDHSDKQVVGSTYKDIHQLVDQVAESGFFDTVGQVPAEPETDAAASDAVDEPTKPEPAAVEDGKSSVNCCNIIY